MTSEEWRQIAHNYSFLSEPARADYWRQLTPDQQAALRDALAVSGSAGASLTATQPQSPRARRGCGGPIAMGCIGMILGSMLTVAAEIAAVMMGVQAVSDAFHSVSSSSASAGSTSDASDDQGAQAVERYDPLDPHGPEAMAYRKRKQEEQNAERWQRARENGEIALDDPNQGR